MTWRRTIEREKFEIAQEGLKLSYPIFFIRPSLIIYTIPSHLILSTASSMAFCDYVHAKILISLR